MNTVKVIACIAIAVACVAFAAKVPLDDSGLAGAYANKAVIAAYQTNVGGLAWNVIETGVDAAKTVITIPSALVDNNILIKNGAKQVKSKKATGTINNLVFGDETLALANGVMVKMKGVAIGTVLGNSTKLAFADSIVNFATDTVGGKGGKVMSKLGDLGGPDAMLGDAGMGTLYSMIKAKANVNGNLEALPAKAGKSKIQGVGGTVTNVAGGAWKVKGVTLL